MAGRPARGEPVSLPGLVPGRPGLVVLLGPECRACRALVPRLLAARERLPVLVGVGPGAGAEGLAAEVGATPGLWEELHPRWAPRLTPLLVAVGADGRVAWADVGDGETLDAAVAALLRTTTPLRPG
ncbi:MAG: hypothetical protein R3C15_21735 [Thermoleophilia bacterium]